MTNSVYHNFTSRTTCKDRPKNDKEKRMANPNNIMALNRLSGLIKIGEITPAENQAAAIVLKNSDRALS